MKAYVKAISYFIPEKVRTNAEISASFPEWTEDKIVNKIGIKERRISEPEQFASDLAIEAANLLFKENSIEKESIDFLLYCTQSPDYFLPTTACILQDKLGLKKSIGALDFNLGCSGYVYGLSLAKGLILAGSAKNVLLITADTYSKFIHPADKSNITLFGDAASATLISNEDNGEGMEICEFVFGTDGSGANNLIVKNGGLRNPVLNGMDEEEEGVWIKNDNHLYMNGNAIFQFTTSSVPSLVNQTLAKNNIELKDIDFYVFHQANKFMLDFIRKKIGIPSDKFCIDLEMTGNTVSSTIPIALFESMKSKRIQLGHKVLLAGFGVGYSWGGVILKYQGN